MSAIPKLRFSEFNDNWKPNSLSEVTETITDGTHFSPETFDVGEYKYITSKNIRMGRMKLDDISYISAQDHENIYSTCRVELGDVLLTKDGASTGNICLNELDEEFSLLSSVALIKADKFQTSNKYLYHYFVSPNGSKEVKKSVAGQAITRITLTNLSSFKFKFPSLPEQKKIADFLGAVDDKIAGLRERERLLTKYKKGVMQKIFTQTLRFKADDGSDFPDWEDATIETIANCLDNLRKPINSTDRQKIQGPYPYWGANNVMDHINDYLFDEPLVLLAEDGGNFDQFQDRPIANLSYGKCWVNNHAHILTAKKGTVIEFLFYSLVHKNIIRYINGGTRSKLNRGDMMTIKMRLPHLDEQQKIADFLSAIDDKITTVSAQITQMQDFKKGLLQQMFV